MQNTSDFLLYTDAGMVFWSLISFGIVFLILWWKVWPVITKTMDQRIEKIKADLDRAKEAASAADDANAEARKIIADASTQAHHIVTEAKDAALKVRDKIVEDARHEAQSVIDNGLAQVEQAKRQAVESLRSNVIDLSIGLTAQLIGKNLDPKDHESLIQEHLEKFDATRIN